VPSLHACRSTLEDPPEQKERFLKRFGEGEPKWAAMAMTEPHCGSDTAAIRTTARLSEDGKEWILNGEKIFVTGGLMAAKESRGFVVVWATVDPSAGRAGMKPFGTELEFVIMVIAVSCVKLLSAHNSTQHTSRKHKV
jgi:Acyl-CoA dehydrogenases